MGIFETYTKRLKKQNGKSRDVYKYDSIPQPLKVQIIHIWKDTIGNNEKGWEYIHDSLARENGVFDLSPRSGYVDKMSKCFDFLLVAELENALDIVEFTFLYIDQICRRYSSLEQNILQVKQQPDSAIEELNYRFKEHAIGYEFISGRLMRIDSQLIHEEAIRPAINLLYETNFKGANNEFLKAHSHYRKGNYKEAISEALKSFESTMKTICQRKNYPFKETDTASKLISIIIDNGLVPTYLTSHFTGLRTTLEAGVPTVRNKDSGHGQGEAVVVIPEHLASYAINLAATNIVFLVKAYTHNK